MLSSLKKHIGIYGLLALYAGLLCAPLLLGKTLYWGDILLYFLPMADFQRESFLQGQIPLWNPHVLLGQPLLGNPQMGVFYPPNLLLFFFPGWLSLSLLTISHLFLCGVFCFHFLRFQKLSRLASLIGALTYAGSSAIIARLQFPPMVQVAPYLPLLLLLIDKICGQIMGKEEKQFTAVPLIPNPYHLLPFCLCLTVTVALMLLASHPQMAYLSLLIAIPYAIYRVRQKTGRWFHPIWFPFAGFFALGVGLCAVQLLPTLQLLRESPREQMTPEMANRFFLEARQLLTLIFPRVLGHPAFGDYKAAGNAWEPAIFVGWLPLVATIYAMKTQRQFSAIRFWIIVGAVNLWLAFGVKAYLFRLAFLLVPGVSKFHDPARFLFPLTFALVVLCAFGVDHWLKMQKWVSFAIKLLAVLLTALPLLWSAQIWNPTANPSAIYSEVLTPQVKSAGRVYLPNYERLWKRYVNYNDYGTNSDALIKAFRETQMPNVGMISHTEMVHGYEPVPLLRPLAFVGALQEQLKRGEPQAKRLLEMAAVSELRGEWGSDALLPGLIFSENNSEDKKGKEEGSAIFAMSEPPLWIHVVGKTRRIEGETRTLAVLSDPHFDPEKEAIVGEEGSEELQSDALNSPAKTRHLERTVHKWKAEVELNADRAFVFFSQVGYPGWRVTVDGEAKPLVRANGAFCGVYITGRKMHKIEMEFLPSAYRLGLYGSLMSFAVLSGLIGFVFASRNRKRVG